MTNPARLIQKLFWNFSFLGCDTDGFLENLSSNFRNFNFRGMSWTDFWKIYSSFFWLPIPFLSNIEAGARTISGKIVHIWMNFPEIGLCHAPEFIKNYFSTICFVLEEFSRNRSSSYSEFEQNWISTHKFDWMSFP